jgi:hypothetical protein
MLLPLIHTSSCSDLRTTIHHQSFCEMNFGLSVNWNPKKSTLKLRVICRGLKYFN